MDWTSDNVIQDAPKLAAGLAENLLRPWTLYQLLIIVGCFAVALFLSRFLETPLEERARGNRGNPGLLRIIVALLRRLEWAIFLLLLWVTREAIMASTWPSRSYLVSSAIGLSFAWLSASVLTRAFRNKTLAKAIALAAFAYVAVGIPGVRAEVNGFLDSLAIAIETAGAVKRVIKERKPVCWLTACGASSLDFKLRFWIEDPKDGLTNIRGQVLIALWDAFKNAGIGIPFPHREIVMRTPVEIVRGRQPED